MAAAKRTTKSQQAEAYQHPEFDPFSMEVDHLAGTVSAPFATGEHGQVAVKVIDQRGNELLVVTSLKEAGK